MKGTPPSCGAAAFALALAALATASPAVADERVVMVEASRRWTDAGLDLKAGDVVRLEASGRWRDWWIEVTPEGHDPVWLRPFAPLLRLPRAKWFALSGCVGKSDDECFSIGDGPHVARRDGRLHLFANDIGFMYWNNSGEATVRASVSRDRRAQSGRK